MSVPPEIERQAGMEVYASLTEPCHAEMKRSDDDFQVTEILRVVPELEPRSGYYPVYKVVKRSIDTLHLAAEMAGHLKSRVSYAGIKDKRAVAVQYVSPTSRRSARPARIEGEKFTAELVGYLPRPVGRYAASGNRFSVRLRNCCGEMEERLAEVSKLAGERKIPNFYGLQRFGGRNPITHRIGRALVKRNFSEAVRLILCEKRGGEDERAERARELAAAQEYSEAASLFQRSQDTERLVARSLAERREDYIGALRAVPIALRRIFTQAYQSYLFNRTLSLAITRGLDISKAVKGDNWGEVGEDFTLTKVHGVREPVTEGGVPLVQLAGYAYRNYGGRFDLCLEEVMREESVTARDFYVEEMQEVSVEGGFRRPFMTVREFSFDGGGGEYQVSFSLAKGEYATVLLREAVKPADPGSCGFA